MPRIFTFLFLAAALPLFSCTTRRDFPEPTVGWHSISYNVVFGQLQRLPPTAAGAPPVWTIRFGAGSDPNQGLFALTPPERLVGYSGGEHVEIRGHLFDQQTTDAYNGRWYVVNSIQYWPGYH